MFQSLIHQVSVSFMTAFKTHIKNIKASFNPLFIRSVFLFQFIKPFFRNLVVFQSLIHQVSVSFGRRSQNSLFLLLLRFNPLFIRSVFLFDLSQIIRNEARTVSIPYSSGQCFFSRGISSAKRILFSVSIPYSSGQCFFF